MECYCKSIKFIPCKTGYNSVATPYAITVNLTGKIRYYPVYYDAQEYINGHGWTCGPTSMSMISQALNGYSSEKNWQEYILQLQVQEQTRKKNNLTFT